MLDVTLLPDAPGQTNDTISELELSRFGPWLTAHSDQPDPAVEQRLVEWKKCFHVRDEFDEYRLRQLVTETIRIERCQREEFARIRAQSNRARQAWDADRNAKVLAIVAKLPRNPQRWKAELMLTLQGCLWLIGEWESLRATLLEGKEWDARQRSKAFDLLGVPTMFRQDHQVIDPPADAPADFLVQFVNDRIKELQETATRNLRPLDEHERKNAEQGFDPDGYRQLAALRRFEAGCHRRYDQISKHLQRKEPAAKPASQGRLTDLAPASFPTFQNPTVSVAEEQTKAKTIETERLSGRSNSQTPPSPPRNPAPPALMGNRKQRRRAAALARKG